jgi:hypothetical protein
MNLQTEQLQVFYFFFGRIHLREHFMGRQPNIIQLEGSDSNQLNTKQ